MGIFAELIDRIGVGTPQGTIKRLQRLSFAHEVLLARDAALNVLFVDSKRAYLIPRVEEATNDLLHRIGPVSKRRLGKNAEEWARRQARHSVFSVHAMLPGNQGWEGELGLGIQRELQGMGVWEKFQQAYPKGMVTTDPPRRKYF